MKNYGQVEPNHLSAQRTGQIYAQLPLSLTAFPNGIENGMFAKYDYAKKEVNLTGDGEWMLVYNEVKVYDKRESYADFIMAAGKTPRLFKTNVGDIFTTNKFATEITAGMVNKSFAPNASGILAEASEGDMLWKAVQVYTMPDGTTPGVKLQRVK
jgi:hypothetical protein